jgi:hypothetical protein
MEVKREMRYELKTISEEMSRFFHLTNRSGKYRWMRELRWRLTMLSRSQRSSEK